MTHHLQEDVVIGFGLRGIQLFHAVQLRFTAMIEPAHLLLIQTEEATVHQLLHHRGGAVALVHQFLAGNLRHRRAVHGLIPVRHGQIVHHHLLLFRCPRHHVERNVHHLLRAELLAQRHIGLGLRLVGPSRLHAHGQRRIHHLADGRHVVVGNPAPQPQLCGQQHGTTVEHVHHRLHLKVRLAVVHLGHHRHVGLALSQWHHDAHTRLRRHPLGQQIGEKALQGQRQDDVDVGHAFSD